jgi:hypothetical protein
MPEPTARERIENLWDRAFPVGPLLDAHRDQILTEAAELLRNATVPAHESEGVDAAADLVLAARTSQEN